LRIASVKSSVETMLYLLNTAAVACPLIFMMTVSALPAFLKFLTALRRKSCTSSPLYLYHMKPPSSLGSIFVLLPSPQASHAFSHSTLKFLSSKTFPVFGSTSRSIIIRTDGSGMMRGSSDLVCSSSSRMSAAFNCEYLQSLCAKCHPQPFQLPCHQPYRCGRSGERFPHESHRPR
jgi:hypothetical protein